MTTVSRRLRPDVTVLHRVPYKVYAHLTEVPENRHLKMAYHDGTLEIVSPRMEAHEEPTRWLAILIPIVAEHLGFRYHGSRSTTFRRAGGGGPYSGNGKEPDECFYINRLERIPRGRDLDLDAGDPPPDIWIEVDNRVSSAARMPIYAALGIPEVWRYRSKSKTLRFLQLIGDHYEATDRSLALPVLTPSLVLDALALGDGLFESDWVLLARQWVVRTFPAQPLNP